MSILSAIFSAVIGRPYGWFKALVSMPWLGWPVRWVLPAAMVPWSSVVFPALSGNPIGRLWMGVVVWIAIRFAARGMVVFFLVVDLYVASILRYVGSIASPVIFDRGRGLVQAAIVATSSPDPGLLFVWHDIASIAAGPGISWGALCFLILTVSFFCTRGSHIYYDVQDYLAFRFSIRAPLWLLICCGAMGSVFSELRYPLTGLLHPVAAFAGTAGVAVLFAVGAAVSGSVQAYGRRFLVLWRRPATSAVSKSAGRAINRSADRPVASVAPVVVAASAVQTSSDSAASADGSLRAPVAVGAVPVDPTMAAARPVLPVEVLEDDGVLVATLPPPGRLSYPADVHDIDAIEAARREAVVQDSQSELIVEDQVPKAITTLRFHLSHALEESDVAMMGALLNTLDGHWRADEVGDSPNPRRMLTLFGSTPIGRVVLRCLAEGMNDEEAFHRIASSRQGGDDIPDTSWLLDESLRPMTGESVDPEDDASSSVASSDGSILGFGDASDLPALMPVKPPADFHQLSDAESAFDFADQLPDPPVGLHRGAVSSVRYSEPKPVVVEAMAGVVVPIRGDMKPSTPPAASVLPLADPWDERPTLVAAFIDTAGFDLGVGESDSETLLHPLESADRMSAFLAHVRPLDLPEATAIFAREKWLLSLPVAVLQFAESISSLTPDGGSIAEFMMSMSRLTDILHVADVNKAHRLFLSLVLLDNSVSDAERASRVGKVAYALCGPWRRNVHATVGGVLARGESYHYDPESDVDTQLDLLCAVSDEIVLLFPSFGDDGSAANIIAERGVRLAALRSVIADTAKAQRGTKPSREESRIAGRGKALRAVLEPAAEILFRKLESLASLREGLQAVISVDSVLGSAAQENHTLRVAQRDVLAEGGLVMERIDAAIVAYRVKARVGPDTPLLQHILDGMSPGVPEFVDEVRRVWANAAERPVPSRRTIDGLMSEVQVLRAAEAERVASSKVGTRDRITAEWARTEDDPFDAIVRRRAIEEEALSDESAVKPEWAMIQTRELLLPSGPRVFLHEAGSSGDARRVMLVPLFGYGLVWGLVDDSFVPLGSTSMGFNLKAFAVDHRVAIRSQRVNDLKVMLFGGTLSPEIEDLVMSSKLDRNHDLTREEVVGQWWRGTIVLAADMIGSRGGVALPGGMYFEVSDLSSMREATRVAS